MSIPNLKKSRVFLFVGIGLVIFSFYIFGSIFYPVILMEIQYRTFNQTNQQIPVRDDFKIVIPKIDINSEVLTNVNPYEKKEYLAALNKGAAQAKGSALPGDNGNVFIFAHSTDSPMNITKLNAVFYLVNKLTPGDEIFLYYQNKSYKYLVDEIKIVNPSEVQYLKSNGRNSLTLMTCWPPGTTLKRLLVIGHPT